MFSELQLSHRHRGSQPENNAEEKKHTRLPQMKPELTIEFTQVTMQALPPQQSMQQHMFKSESFP